MLKNWTSVFKSISKKKGGLLNYLTYLTNNNHKNHKDSEHKIIDFGKKINQVYVNNLKVIDEMNYKKILEGKGGRPSNSFGVSVVLSLPYKIEEKEKLKVFAVKFLNQYYKDLCRIHNIEYSEKGFKKWNSLVFFNVHLKNDGSKTQFNFTFPHYLFKSEKKIIKNFISKEEREIIKPVKIDMSKKKCSYLFKTLSNLHIKHVFGLDNEKYIKESSEKIKHRQSQNFYKLSKAEKEINVKIKELEKKKEILTSTNKKLKLNKFQFEVENKKIENEIKEKQKILEKLKITMKEINDRISAHKWLEEDKTLQTYKKRLENAIQEQNKEKMEKLHKQIDKRIEKINTLNSTKPSKGPRIG